MVYLRILAWFIILCVAVWLTVYIIESAENPANNQPFDWGIAKDNPILR